MSKNTTRRRDDPPSPAQFHQDVAAPCSSPDALAGDDLHIGARLRVIRKARGLTIRSLAERCQLSANTLSLIENERTSPGVHTLYQLARGLGVSIHAFLESEAPEQSAVYQRQGERRVTRFANGTLENLGQGLPHLGAEPVLVTLEPRSNEAHCEAISHAGREFVYCLEGCVTCMIAGRAYELCTGDSLLFNALAPHCWINAQAKPSRLLVLFCPMDVHDRLAEQHLE